MTYQLPNTLSKAQKEILELRETLDALTGWWLMSCQEWDNKFLEWRAFIDEIDGEDQLDLDELQEALMGKARKVLGVV